MLFVKKLINFIWLYPIRVPSVTGRRGLPGAENRSRRARSLRRRRVRRISAHDRHSARPLPTETIRLVEREAVTLYEAESALPYALWLTGTAGGEYAGITAYDSGGAAGVLINETDAAVSGARTQYE